MPDLLREIEQRWETMFSALAAGADVPPSQRLRTEGMMQSAVLLELASEPELSAAMDRCYRDAFGRGIDDEFGAHWQDFFPFPQIPAMGLRAPVYPSTGD